jgi:hypothetical protein
VAVVDQLYLKSDSALIADKVGWLPEDWAAPPEMFVAALFDLLEEARSVDDRVLGGNGETELLESLLKFSIAVSLEYLHAGCELEISWVEKLANVPALLAQVIVLVHGEPILGVFLEVLKIEFTSKSRVTVYSLPSSLLVFIEVIAFIDALIRFITVVVVVMALGLYQASALLELGLSENYLTIASEFARGNQVILA